MRACLLRAYAIARVPLLQRLAYMHVTRHDGTRWTGNATIQCGGKMLSVEEAQAVGMEKGSSAGTIPSDEEIVAMAKAMLAGWE
eukprot:COSAG06_NODE_901_length_11650_cov_7.150203_7_plen_84_part_00